MSDQSPTTPVSEEPEAPQTTPKASVPAASAPAASTPPSGALDDQDGPDERYGERLERLGGEPAPVITPDEFARLQRAGQVHIDARGRVRTTRRSDAEAGVSLKKRRAWYKPHG
ncbi:MAG: hypothetical protein L6Q98_14135 [Anaerolineae bacterium]|nr:hypothetical protein [Anaerolineae bacterium]NUQ03360.1 hypothetical protein [Anaerolineae bacterium]